jgi:hypothetical protein
MRNFETTFDLRCGRILEINGLERVIKESIAAAPEALVIGRIGDDFACVVEQPRHHQVAALSRREAQGHFRRPADSLVVSVQPCFGMIEVALNAAQNFIIDDIFIAQLNNRPAFHIERVLL